MTQCILSHILADDHWVDSDRLEAFYDDCLIKDQALDDLADEQEEDIVRRQLAIYGPVDSELCHYECFLL